MEISFHSHLDSNIVIATKFCTWHDSCAVVACAKICCDLMASNRVMARRIFHRIWIAGKKTLVKRAPGRGTTPSGQFGDFFTEHTDTAIFAWQLNVSQMKQRVKRKLSTWILSPVFTKYMRPYFQHFVDKGLFQVVWTPCINFSFQSTCLYHWLCNMHTIYMLSPLRS